MKRKLFMFLTVVSAISILAPLVNAQEKEVEKKVEKRIMVVTVDENGEKTIIDTVVTGDTDLEALHLEHGMKGKEMIGDETKHWVTKEGNVMIMSDDENSFTFHSADNNKLITEEGEVVIVKKGDGKAFSIVKAGDDEGDKFEYITVHIDEDAVHSEDGHFVMKSGKGKGHNYFVTVDSKGGEDLKEGDTHLVIRSKDELQDIYINGDAVITIKDGKIKVDGKTVKIDVKKSGDLKVVKEKKVEKEVKTKKKK